MITKSYLQWNPISVVKISPQAELKPVTARSVGQPLTHLAAKAPKVAVKDDLLKGLCRAFVTLKIAGSRSAIGRTPDS